MTTVIHTCNFITFLGSIKLVGLTVNCEISHNNITHVNVQLIFKIARNTNIIRVHTSVQAFAHYNQLTNQLTSELKEFEGSLPN